MINSFSGEYRFLSNFYPARVKYDGTWYPSVEHAYQAAKTLDEFERDSIAKTKQAGKAKEMGKHVKLRPGWEKMKLGIMEELIYQKFQDPTLKKMLLDTGDCAIVEGNDWGDTYWGVCNGRGDNHLGKILVRVRDRISK